VKWWATWEGRIDGQRFHDDPTTNVEELKKGDAPPPVKRDRKLQENVVKKKHAAKR
jgi:hypothetical protein